MDCEICVSPFNQSTRKRVSCPACRLNVCVACVKTYTAGSLQASLDITCMQCKHLWDTEFVCTHISRSLVAVHKRHVEKLLIDQERTKLPETQYYIEYDHAMERIVRPQIEQLIESLIELQNKHERAWQEGTLADVQDAHRLIRKTRREINWYSRHLEAWRFHKRMTCTPYIPDHFKKNNTTTPHDKKEKIAQHVFPCSEPECPGFVMDDTYACGTCKTSFCKKCYQRTVLDHPHVCQAAFLATADDIRRNTKACPKCAIRIHKIEGCDQMWCTQCHTGFSWLTGKIESEDRIHNPHYFEWASRNRGETPGNNCRPVRMHMLTHCGVLFGGGSPEYEYFVEQFRLNSHMRFIEMEQHFVQTERDHLDLRLRFLKKEITEKHLGTVLYKRHKEYRVNTRRAQVCQFFVDASNDIFNRLMYQCSSAEQAVPLQRELEALNAYTNECFVSLKKTYHMKMPVIRFHYGTFETSGYNGFLPME